MLITNDLAALLADQSSTVAHYYHLITHLPNPTLIRPGSIEPALLRFAQGRRFFVGCGENKRWEESREGGRVEAPLPGVVTGA